MVLSSAIVCDRLRLRSQTIANVCFHMIANERKTFCDLDAIVCDHMETRLLIVPRIFRYSPGSS